MDQLLGLIPVIAILVFAIVVVWRGLRRKPDSANYREGGGGPGVG